MGMKVAIIEIGIAREIARVGRQFLKNKNIIKTANNPPIIALFIVREVTCLTTFPISIISINCRFPGNRFSSATISFFTFSVAVKVFAPDSFDTIIITVGFLLERI